LRAVPDAGGDLAVRPAARRGGHMVHVLNTGGTISYGAPGADGATLTHSPDQVLSALGTTARIAYREVLRKGSVNMMPSDWQTIAAAARAAVAEGADGIVILHGTDTMAFTAAALSFMLERLPVPVIFTGSMRPGGAPDSDAPRNMRDAVRVAAAGDLAEVFIVFSRDAVGSGSLILRGNRSRKASATALNAFASPGYPPLGSLRGRVIRYGQAARQSRARRGDVALSAELNPNVCWIPYHPGCAPDFVAGALARADGAVIAGTGLGHLPTDGGFLEAVRDSQKPVVLVSACWHAQVRLGPYDIDRAILATENLIPGHDLTPEAAVVKLMWVLGREQALDRVRARMQEPIAGELTATSERVE